MDQKRKPIIGLAGGIGSGKSTVAQMLAELGCLVSNSDDLARAALRDPAIKSQIVQWWGEGVQDKQGEIDRAKVASIVFDDPAERKRLEALVHPWIEARRREQFASAPPEAPALVIDAPLLFEANLDKHVDVVIYVDADRPVRLSRVMATRGWTEAELAKREQSQLPLDEKRSRADYIVMNNGDLSELRSQIRQILSTIVDSCRT